MKKWKEKTSLLPFRELGRLRARHHPVLLREINLVAHEHDDCCQKKMDSEGG